MKKIALTGLMASLTTALASGVAFANMGPRPTPVPEISALEGTAAIAALAAIVLLTWERRRRAH
ncbi:VPEID-CTERM sorting domain-containing protein [Paracoccus zhejiangensis]|uniref:VPEID-CTERM sorting domain-containing protein n=1 Tax=Paracoccus zhejiangensis TaxID=1077935 RepID=A0A2H5F0B2_9RHOB|nr:VPEID-CTERM sorting domain-containing protein [Paracoccus zhejiangensis]AUH64995.1 VPEID-CTERM sorting domain-containing protein [Paracoccus zhejiangensis]